MEDGRAMGGSVVDKICWLSWWRHQMETFSAQLAICAGNSPVPGEFPAQRQVTRSFDVYFDLRLNKQLSKQSWGWWFETLSRPFWRHRNDQQRGKNNQSSRRVREKQALNFMGCNSSHSIWEIIKHIHRNSNKCKNLYACSWNKNSSR